MGARTVAGRLVVEDFLRVRHLVVHSVGMDFGSRRRSVDLQGGRAPDGGHESVSVHAAHADGRVRPRAARSGVRQRPPARRHSARPDAAGREGRSVAVSTATLVRAEIAAICYA